MSLLDIWKFLQEFLIDLKERAIELWYWIINFDLTYLLAIIPGVAGGLVLIAFLYKLLKKYNRLIEKLYARFPKQMTSIYIVINRMFVYSFYIFCVALLIAGVSAFFKFTFISGTAFIMILVVLPICFVTLISSYLIERP